MSIRDDSNTYERHGPELLSPSPVNNPTSQHQSQPLSESSQFNYVIDSNEVDDTDASASRYITEDATDHPMSQHPPGMERTGNTGGEYPDLAMDDGHGMGMRMGGV